MDLHTVTETNKLIVELSEEERNNVSDWYHTFGELYEHRIHLYIAYCKLLNKDKRFSKVIKSKTHFDWSVREWRFIIQTYHFWKQISYHLPDKYRDTCKFVRTRKRADERDWHTSQDVLDRLLLV